MSRTTRQRLVTLTVLVTDVSALTDDHDGDAACFDYCPNLKIAEGTFPGYVDFSNSGIKKTGELTITKPNDEGFKADFTGCDIRLPTEFLGSEFHVDDAVRQKNLIRIAASKALKASPEIEI